MSCRNQSLKYQKISFNVLYYSNHTVEKNVCFFNELTEMKNFSQDVGVLCYHRACLSSHHINVLGQNDICFIVTMAQCCQMQLLLNQCEISREGFQATPDYWYNQGKAADCCSCARKRLTGIVPVSVTFMQHKFALIYSNIAGEAICSNLMLMLELSV